MNVGKQPDLAEHYWVIATPALLKLYPIPRQILAGSNLGDRIDNWWERWQEELISGEDVPNNYGKSGNSDCPPTEQLLLSESIGYVSKLIKLTDEVFTLKQENQELLDRLKLQDRAMSVLAHDLRNPLTAAALALGTLEIVHNQQDYRANSLDPETIAKPIERGRTQLQSIDRLVTDILQPRSTTTECDLRPQKIDLTHLISGVMSAIYYNPATVLV